MRAILLRKAMKANLLDKKSIEEILLGLAKLRAVKVGGKWRLTEILSPFTVKRVWMHWTKTKMPQAGIMMVFSKDFACMMSHMILLSGYFLATMHYFTSSARKATPRRSCSASSSPMNTPRPATRALAGPGPVGSPPV
ncbi:MAG: hypothetical protein M0Q43_00800 [Methanothrix sp.]|jgi:hypothetical protein|nr:hypothetical protein [Methanothrix sp.]